MSDIHFRISPVQNTVMQLYRAILVLGLILTTVTVSAQREKIDLSVRGPQPGETIPEFSLPDQYGTTWTDRTILGPNGTMLVFIRSAYW